MDAVTTRRYPGPFKRLAGSERDAPADRLPGPRRMRRGCSPTAPAPATTLYNTCRRACATSWTIETRTEADEDASSDIAVAPCAASSTFARKLPQAIISGGTMMDNRVQFGRCIDPHQAGECDPTPAGGRPPPGHLMVPNEPHCCERSSSTNPGSVQENSQRPESAGIAHTMRND